jgi:hypothetical protein
MNLKDIIRTLMLSDFYFSLPLWERKEVAWRLLALYGPKHPMTSHWPCSATSYSQGFEADQSKL